MTDTEIIHQISLGDKTSFQKLYEEFKVKVFNTTISYVQNQPEAEEITQDVFIEIYRSAAHFKGNSSISTWIYRITVNKCLDHLRHRHRKRRYALLVSLFKKSGELENDIPHFVHPGALMEQQENTGYLFKAIDRLPDQQKSAFILSQIEELPQKEIAEILKVSPKAVESLIQRAKANLRNELEKLYPHRRKT